MQKRAKIPPPAPLTIIDLVAEAFCSLGGLRAFYFLCAPVPPDDIISALQRRMR
jgi:hypothetical protein